MKRRLKENISIGDEVYVPRDEYQGTVVDINGDEVLVDGPFGEEYHNLSDLEKLGGDYEEDETPKFFEKYVTESKRKKVIRLTERDLARIVKQVIKENENSYTIKPKTLQEFLKSCSSGTFRTFTDGTHLKCGKNGFISDKNPYTVGGSKKTGVNGSWKSKNNVVTLTSTLYGEKTLK